MDPNTSGQGRRPGAVHSNPESAAFWEAARAGRFTLGRCLSCGRAHYFPRSLCPFCFGDAQLEEASGLGKIYTFSVTYRGAPEPYAIGYVELAEGPRVLTNFVDCAFASLAIGAPVHLVWSPAEEGQAAPTFTLSVPSGA